MNTYNRFYLFSTFFVGFITNNDVNAFTVREVTLKSIVGASRSISSTSLQTAGYMQDVNEMDIAAPFHATTKMPIRPSEFDTSQIISTENIQTPSPAQQTIQRTSSDEMWSTMNIDPIKVQGNSLRTYSFDSSVERIEVLMKTNGRPLHADVELWNGPDNTPQILSVYLEDGGTRTFRAMLESPGSTNTVAIRNTGQMQYPLIAGVDVDKCHNPAGPAAALSEISTPRVVQGGAVITAPFGRKVQSVQIMMMTYGNLLNAKVELFQGSDNDKQVMEVYTEDGNKRPFYAIIETPGAGNVVRVRNTASIEFPLYVSIEPFLEEM